jgi:hypothetical protein
MGQGSSRKAFYEDQTSTPAQRVLREPFRVKPHDFGFDPNLDLDKARQLADVLESFETVKKLGS